MDSVVNPFILYAAIALGGIGVLLALPRRGVNPQLIGTAIAALGGGIVVVLLSLAGLKAEEGLPNIHFYIFSAIALGSALRVISHPRPVYSALYFILTILSSAGLYLILSAEFMAFALIIIYAGAILITYLFVIMLATQAPSEEQIDDLADYDTEAREPMVATLAGFVLLAVLSTLIFSGTHGLLPAGPKSPLEIADLPRSIERALVREDLMDRGDSIVIDNYRASMQGPAVLVERADGTRDMVMLPDGVEVANAQQLANDFLHNHPVTIEIAGVILLMAMLGATILSRRQVMMDEEAKESQLRTLAGRGGQS